MKKSNRFFILLTLAFCNLGLLQAQTDDLMFVEYVDWTSGSGWAVKVYNPTSNSINLSDYYIRVYRNGATSFTENINLSGNLASKQTIILGNDAYCINECGGSCDITINSLGINGNEVIELATETCTIDLIGAIGVDFGSQNGWTIDGTTKATYRQTLTRKSNNGIRYTKSDGSVQSWPLTKTNFTGYNVSSVGCLSNGFYLSVVVPNTNSAVHLNFEDSVICTGDLIDIIASETANWEIVETGFTAPNLNKLLFSQGPGTYHIIAKSLNCGGDDTCTVIIRDGGHIKINGETTVCEGGELRFYTDIVGGNVWQNATTIDTFTLSNIISDTEVVVQNSTTGCGEAYDTLQISVVKKPSLATGQMQIEFSNDSIINVDDIISTSGTAYSKWTLDGIDLITNEATYIYDKYSVLCVIAGPTEYCVDTFCIDLIPKTIVPDFVFSMPNVFTPNADDINDTFYPYLEGGKIEMLQIYNRWGERLFESTEENQHWDGIYKNNPVPVGTYFYIGSIRNLTDDSIHNINGIVEVIR